MAYDRLLKDYPTKWVMSAGDVCFMFVDNGISICKYIDREDSNCISLYTIDKSGSMVNEIIIRENEDKPSYDVSL